MASSGWRTDRPLSTLVFEQYGRFNAYQLVRLLRWKPDSRQQPSAWNIAQRFRFRADLSAAFPGREISGLKMIQPQAVRFAGRQRTLAYASKVVEIKTPDYCVASAIGPMPEPFTDWVREQEKSREHAMADFLDIFTQRLNVLRFQMKSRQVLGLNIRPPEQTPHAHYLAALMGMVQPSMAAQIPLPRRAWLALAGLLSNCRKSSVAVTQVLSLFLDTQVKMTELVGAWQAIEQDDRMALGRRNNSLGKRTLLGRQVWDQQARVRLDIGPLDYKRFYRLLPPDHPAKAANPATEAPSLFDGFVTLLRLLLDRLCDVEVLLHVRTGTIPPAALQAAPTNGNHGLRLGRTAWTESKDHHGTRSASYLVRAYDSPYNSPSEAT